MGLSDHDSRGQPLAISLAVINISIVSAVWVHLMLAIGRVLHVWGVGDIVDLLTCHKALFIVSVCYEASDAAPFPLVIW